MVARDATIAAHEATIAARDATIAELRQQLSQGSVVAQQAATIASLRRQLEQDVVDVDAGTVVRAVVPPPGAGGGAGAAASSSSSSSSSKASGMQLLQRQSEVLRQVKQERGVAEQQREQALDRLQCVICVDAERSVLFLPCSHVAACGGCAARLDECPICRGAIEQKVALNMS